MCGIAGFFGAPSRSLLEGMNDALAHRGPDGGGYVETDVASIGMRRLKIIDLVSGDQPMTTADGRLHLVYNGEVYNFRELRVELEALGHAFRTSSDSEVVLEAYAAWGAEAFRRFNGMWGLALLDERGAEPKLILSRDHFGIKPLYVGRWADRLVFASEIKAILADPAFPRRVNDDVMFDYLAHGLFDHSTATFFEGIESVPAASFVEIDARGMRTERYWEGTLASDGSPDPAAFRVLFERAVSRRLISDVPVGTCLSGGLDSSSITVILAEQLKAEARDAKSLGPRLQTFSAVFPNDTIDESTYIDSVVRATHAVSHRIAPTHRGLIAELDQLVRQVEMPMVSSAPYAMWTVMRMAKDHVTVLIDGQGGDELLGGYDVYPYIYLRELLREGHLRQLVVEAFRWRAVLVPLIASRIRARFQGASDVSLLRPAFRRHRPPAVDERSHDNVKLRLLQDLTTYSLPPLLRYEDRISMSHAIETRLPFLDQELVEAVLRLPTSAIIDRGTSRRILREALRSSLPNRIYRRTKKIGFTTPEFRWFRDEQPALQRILHSPSFTSRPYWDAPAIAEAFRRACEGKGRRSLFFWRVINAEIWLRVYIDPPQAVAEVAAAAA
ncbi:MAG TPA: asparagine synthase (glutamine-hydrolyzing) [Candidatus Dormibacteraeota bacterium]|nr:asparagine synthase (glutamine-hydrolyzing) [Candidatus Dormibacteraeota bacterium]